MEEEGHTFVLLVKNNMRTKYIALSEKYHGQMHLFFGILAWALSVALFEQADLGLLIAALVGAYLPDIDHLLFMFWYGKDTDYSKGVKKTLFDKGFFECIDHVKKHHKGNTAIKSHNLIVVSLCVFLAWWGWRIQSPLLATLFLSCSGHFIYDILEDLLFFGRLNKNWWLDFS